VKWKLVAACCGLALATGAHAQLLYDAALGTLPADQGWTVS
jgi:hypothetical protein